jgi:inner membrane transporter RhtA
LNTEEVKKSSGNAGSVAALLGSGTSTQVGAGIGALAFPAIGPVGVVAVRQLVAAVALLALSRPSPHRMTWVQWWPVLVLAGIFSVMNLSLYVAIDRIGLGLAVTLEFLGPLAVALLGSRGRSELLIAVAAGVGVYVLVLPDASSDPIGIGLALLAAACWAGYIVVNRVAGSRLPGVQAPALAATLSAFIYMPVLVMLVAQGRLAGTPLAYAVAAGVLSSVIPYATDLMVLRSVPPRLFGVLMSAQPGLAALAGLVVLGQVLALHEWIGLAIVATANALAVGLSGPVRRVRAPAPVLEPAA